MGIAAAVAAGVADALRLGLEPATRLSTIAVEASRNVVAHAYPEDRVGSLELVIALAENGARPPAKPRALTVSVRDLGGGMALAPTRGDPPGLGLSMICALSDALAIESNPAAGTTLEATVSLDDGPRGELASTAQVPASESSTLRFEDPSMLSSVLPRALAAHVRDPDMSCDRLLETMVLGDTIADALASAVGQEPLDLQIQRGAARDRLRLRIGPLAGDESARLIDEIGSGWPNPAPRLELATQPAADESAFAIVELSRP